MTLAQFATFLCNRVNQPDSNSVAICKQFINRRYEMIWHARNWKDTIKNVTASLTDTTDGLMDMPATIGRVIAIRSGGDHILIPVDSPMLMQLDPTIFERTGTPISYEEFTDGTTRKIRFKPIPIETTALLITGTRPFVELGDTDSPIIRDIDNTLIAFAGSDMLKRQRQYGKAKEEVEEGGALLQQMIDADTKDSGYMPRVIPVCEPVMSAYDCDNGWMR